MPSSEPPDFDPVPSEDPPAGGPPEDPAELPLDCWEVFDDESADELTNEPDERDFPYR